MSRHATRVPRYPCMMQLMTRGTYYDVGYNVGQTFSERIKLFFAESNNIQDKLLPFYDSRAGRDYYEESVRVCQDSFPQYVREVRGMADGAGLAFEHVFMANMSKEVYNIFFPQWDSLGRPEDFVSLSSKNTIPKKTGSKSAVGTGDHSHAQDNANKSASQDDTAQTHLSNDLDVKSVNPSLNFQENLGCSDVFLNRSGCQYVVHNEDEDPKIKPYGYLLSAHIEEEGEVEEQFTSFCYPGYLPGCAWSFNAHGLTLSVNGLYPDHVVRETPGRLFLNRSILRARDMSDVIRLAKNAPHGVAYGFTVNVSTRDGQMTSVEVAPGKPEGKVHVYDVVQQQDPDAPCHYYHFNSYKQLKDVSEIEGLLSSVRRAERSEELPPPRDLHDALKVMADDHNPLGPIFRTPRPTDAGETVCSAVFDVTERKVLVYQGRDDLLSNSPFAVLPMYK